VAGLTWLSWDVERDGFLHQGEPVKLIVGASDIYATLNAALAPHTSGKVLPIPWLEDGALELKMSVRLSHKRPRSRNK
jgi:hypothetical protein